MSEITEIKAKKISQLPKPDALDWYYRLRYSSSLTKEELDLVEGLADMWMLLAYFSEGGVKDINPTNYRVNLNDLFEIIYKVINGKLNDEIDNIKTWIQNNYVSRELLNLTLSNYYDKAYIDECCGKVQDLLERLDELERRVDSYHVNVFDITYLLENIAAFAADGVSPRPTGVKDGLSETITLKPVNGYHLPETLVVHGAEYTWTLNNDNTGTLYLHNPSSAISISGEGEPNIYNVHVYGDDHSVSNITDSTVAFGNTLEIIYTVDTGYDLIKDNITVNNASIVSYSNQNNTVKVRISPTGDGDISVQPHTTLHNYSVIITGDTNATPISAPSSITINNTEDNPLTINFRANEGFKIAESGFSITGASKVPNSYSYNPDTHIITIKICNPTGNVRITYESISTMSVYFGVIHDTSQFEMISVNDELYPSKLLNANDLTLYNSCPISTNTTVNFGQNPVSVIVVPKEFFVIEHKTMIHPTTGQEIQKLSQTYYTDGTRNYELRNSIGTLIVPMEKWIRDLGEFDGVEYYGLWYPETYGSFWFVEKN